MGFGDVLHDREAQARSRKLACVVRSPEAVENTGRVLRGDARTVIAHGDLAVRDGHLNGCTRRAVLRGVVEQIGNRPGDADLHAVDRGRRTGQVEAHLRIAERHVVDDLVHDLVELQLLERHRRFLVASDLDQIANEGRETFDLAYEIAQELLPLHRVGRLAALEELKVRAQAGEGGPQLVRRVGDQLTLRAQRGLELPEHGIEACAEPAELVPALLGNAT